MHYGKLKVSFLLLLVMSIIQFLVASFLIKNSIISILAILTLILCILGLGYVSKHTK